MEIETKISLDMISDEWGTKVSELVIEELKLAIKKEVKKAIQNDESLKKAIKAIQKSAAEQIINAMNKQVPR